MTESAQRCEHNAVFFKLNIAFKMAHSCCFLFSGKSDFLQKLYYIDYRKMKKN